MSLNEGTPAPEGLVPASRQRANLLHDLTNHTLHQMKMLPLSHEPTVHVNSSKH